MTSLMMSLGAWNWLIAGMILLGLELIAPGMFLLWLGIAALAVGVISFGVDWSWQTQAIAFALLSAAMVPLWRRMARSGAPTSGAGGVFLNRRADELVGREFVLEKPIVDGFGTVRVDDTVWRVSGADCPAGTRIRVTRADGAMLFAEKV